MYMYAYEKLLKTKISVRYFYLYVTQVAVGEINSYDKGAALAAFEQLNSRTTRNCQ